MAWAMVAGAAITVVGGAIANNQKNKAANGAANAQERSQQLAIDEQRRQFDLSRQDQAPWMQAGQDALGKQQAFLGGDWSGFQNSPDYKYALDQGLNSIDHRAAARGGLFGGGNTRDAMTFASGLATQNANGYYSKLAGLSGTGANTAQGLGALGANMANNIGNSYTNMGNARASAYQQRGDNNSQFATGVAGAFNNGVQNYYARNGGWG